MAILSSISSKLLFAAMLVSSPRLDLTPHANVLTVLAINEKAPGTSSGTANWRFKNISGAGFFLHIPTRIVLPSPHVIDGEIA